MNLVKMRKNLFRAYPNVEEKTFDPLRMTDYEVQDFLSRFSRKMQEKHGKNLKDISTFECREYDTGLIRIQVVANLHTTRRLSRGDNFKATVSELMHWSRTYPSTNKETKDAT